MTKERVNAISEVLAQNIDEAKALLELSPEAAATKLNACGFEVTADELVAYGEELKKIGSATEGELSENDLDNVAGGIAASTLLLVGIVVGYAMSKGKW